MSDGKRPNSHGASRPPAAGVEQVKALCGHAVPFELFGDKKDIKFRDARRKKVTDRPCPECRRKAHEERTAVERKAAEGRRRTRPAEATNDRLPHGSRFDVVWDAEKGQWSGTLAVPAAKAGGEPSTFTASASGVFPLLRQLDRMYRDSLPAVDPAEDDNRDVGGEG